MKRKLVKVLIYPDNVCICVNNNQVLFFDGDLYSTYIDGKAEQFLEFKNALQYFQKKIKLKLSKKIIKEFTDTVEKEYKKIGGYGILKQMQDLQPFTSKDKQRYVLNGVAIKDGAIVATDGRRLSCYTIADETINIIASNQTIKICGIVFKNITNLDCKINDKFIYFSDGQSEYYGRFIDGVYPNWKQVIPEDKKIKYTYFIENGNDLYELVERLKIKAKKEDIKRLEFYFNDNKIEITNEIDMKLEYITKNITGQKPIIVSLNQNYLDFLKDTKTIKISFENNQSPIQFEDEVRRTIVMPLRKF